MLRNTPPESLINQIQTIKYSGCSMSDRLCLPKGRTMDAWKVAVEKVLALTLERVQVGS